jgi:hypothetical protein
MFVLLKETYSDFDMAYDTVIAVSHNRSVLKDEAQRLTLLLTDKEKDDGINYHIQHKKVKVM